MTKVNRKSQLCIWLSAAFMLLYQTDLYAQYKTYFTVAADGSGDYTTIQEAIDNCKSFPDKQITIFVRNGIYKEKVKVHSWNTHISLIGESVEKTIITYDDFAGKKNNGTFYTYTVLVQANDFRAENLTIENTAGRVGQAVALHVESDRVIIKNCRITGNQDTIYAAGENSRQYYYNCYIEGTTDYIFGAATAIFEKCTLHSKADSYITAASTPQGVKYGYVFIDCKLTADEQVKQVYLGRPWRPFAKTVFMKCDIGKFIRPEGWHNWSDKTRETTTFYAEYACNGQGAESEKRVAWSKKLTKKEAATYTLSKIFRDWIPQV